MIRLTHEQIETIYDLYAIVKKSCDLELYDYDKDSAYRNTLQKLKELGVEIEGEGSK